MTVADLAIVGGTIATDYGSFEATLAAHDGRIVSIDAPGAPVPDAREVIDATGLLVAPGGIDPHTHFWEPGPYDFREDFEGGTKSCAAGGVTTTLEHPLSVPPVRDAETFLAKRRVAEEKSVIDFGLWGGLLPETAESLAEMHALGAVAFKGFMLDSGADYPWVDDGYLLAGLETAARLGAIIGVHAESDAIAAREAERFQRAGRTDGRAIAESRGPFTEYEAMARAILLAKKSGARLHIVHVSIADGVDLVQEARASGVRVTAETCAHYLHFDWSALDAHGAYAKCKPPLRSPENTDAMWDHVLAGKIDFIASDHSPYSREEKSLGIWEAPWGMTGAQTMIPIVISDGLLGRDWDLTEFVRFTSTNAARTFGLYPRKGTIRVGSDCDLMLIDPDGSWTVRAEDLFSKQPWSLLEGETLRGRIVRTVVRGRVVYADGEITVDPGYGEFVNPRTISADEGSER